MEWVELAFKIIGWVLGIIIFVIMLIYQIVATIIKWLLQMADQQVKTSAQNRAIEHVVQTETDHAAQRTAAQQEQLESSRAQLAARLNDLGEGILLRRSTYTKPTNVSDYETKPYVDRASLVRATIYLSQSEVIPSPLMLRFRVASYTDNKLIITPVPGKYLLDFENGNSLEFGIIRGSINPDKDYFLPFTLASRLYNGKTKRLDNDQEASGYDIQGDYLPEVRQEMGSIPYLIADPVFELIPSSL